MALGTNQITVTTAAQLIPKFWSKRVQKAVEKNLVLAKLFSRWDEELANGGDTFYVPGISNLSANAKSANTQVTLNAPTETKQTYTANRYFECSFVIEDIAKVQASYNMQALYQEKAGYAMALQIDTDLVGLYSSMTQAAGAGNTAITVAAWTTAIEFLDVAEAPDDGGRAAVLHAKALTGLRNLGAVIELRTYGETPTTTKTGKVGALFGIPIYISNNITRLSSPFVTYNMMFHKEFAILAMQQNPRTQMQYKQEYLGNLTTVDAIWAYGTYRVPFGVQMVS